MPRAWSMASSLATVTSTECRLGSSTRPAIAAVSVDRVTDGGPALQALGVGRRRVADAVEHGEDAGRLGRPAVLVRQVGAADDRPHPDEGTVAQLVLVQQALERAAPVAVAQLGAADVEGDAVQLAHVAGAADEAERRGGVDEPPDRPGGGDAVDMDVLAGDVVHAC